MKENEAWLACTTFLVFLSYMMSLLPISIVNVFDSCNTHPELTLMCYCIYWVIYCINNFIYAFRITAYRKAYMKGVKRWLPKLRSKHVKSRVAQKTSMGSLNSSVIKLQVMAPSLKSSTTGATKVWIHYTSLENLENYYLLMPSLLQIIQCWCGISFTVFLKLT